jgi:hypothetical protein
MERLTARIRHTSRTDRYQYISCSSSKGRLSRFEGQLRLGVFISNTSCWAVDEVYPPATPSNVLSLPPRKPGGCAVPGSPKRLRLRTGRLGGLPRVLGRESVAHTFHSNMSGRLASFRGPSTPTSSPVRSQPIPSSKNARSPPPSSLTPHSPKQVTESTYHRKLRQLLQELQKIAGTWDDLVLHDGLRAVKGLVDARTELECV